MLRSCSWRQFVMYMFWKLVKGELRQQLVSYPEEFNVDLMHQGDQKVEQYANANKVTWAIVAPWVRRSLPQKLIFYRCFLQGMSLRFPKKAIWRLQRTLGNHGHIPRLKKLLLHSNLYVHIKESKPVIGLKIYSNIHATCFWQHASHCSSHDWGRKSIELT